MAKTADTYGSIIEELKQNACPAHAQAAQRYFKTGKGEYGEGDIFLGLRMPQVRKTAKKHKNTSWEEVQKLVNNKYHEARMTGFLITVEKYKKEPEKAYKFYLKNAKKANNWDLVDVTSPKVIGAYLKDKPKDTLYKLAKSDNLWERRISIISTFAFKEESFKLAETLLKDKHDLIHKAVGWALREAGKTNKKELKKFLDKHATQMPRTMLRYAIEKFEEKERQYYLKLRT